MRKNPPALWTGTGKEKRNRRSLICCSGRVMVGFIYLGIFNHSSMTVFHSVVLTATEPFYRAAKCTHSRDRNGVRGEESNTELSPRPSAHVSPRRLGVHKVEEQDLRSH